MVDRATQLYIDGWNAALAGERCISENADYVYGWYDVLCDATAMQEQVEDYDE